MQDIEVSVIIPTKNRTLFLERALRSVTEQNIASIEVCVVDNNKEEILKEEVKSLIRSYTINHPSISWLYLFSEKDFVSGARNDGMKKVSGKYICFLDDDDYLLHGSIAARLQAMKENTDTALLYCGCYSKIYPYPFPIYRYYKYIAVKHKNMLMTMSCSTMFISRLLFVQHNLFFDESLGRREDYDLCKQIISKGVKIVSLPQPLMVINLHSQQRMSSNSLQYYDDRETLRNKWGPSVNQNMSQYAEGLHIWRKCFGMKNAAYKTIATQLNKDFGGRRSLTFFIQWNLIAVSPVLFLGIYHCMIVVRQFWHNRISIRK